MRFPHPGGPVIVIPLNLTKILDSFGQKTVVQFYCYLEVDEVSELAHREGTKLGKINPK